MLKDFIYVVRLIMDPGRTMCADNN